MKEKSIFGKTIWKTGCIHCRVGDRLERNQYFCEFERTMKSISFAMDVVGCTPKEREMLLDYINKKCAWGNHHDKTT
ncbi:MAG TPA: hypothetical protein DCX03_01010 [Bacteroidales bacterium]|nr:hypothetical protein [Bacteroidales bacterium]